MQCKRLRRYRKVRREIYQVLKIPAKGVLALAVLVICGLLILVRTAPSEKKAMVETAGSAAEALDSDLMGDEENDSLPAGVAGLVSGVENIPMAGSRVNRMGTSAETVLVGQRVKTVSERLPSFDCSQMMNDRIEDLSDNAVNMSVNAKLMSDYDYENLCAIIEAEAGTEDIKGRILVANVIMNRVAHPEFPDTITDVIYQYVNGIAQFSPVADGKIYSVTVTDDTREAVRQVMAGVDYSEGALFFIQKDASDKHNIKWFENNLKFLFKYGVHDFYTYPS